MTSGAVLRDGIGWTLPVFTTWGFALFAALVVVAVVGRGVGVRRREGVTTVVGGVSSLVAGGLGLLVKHLVAERRPCQLHPSPAPWVNCPPSGNWSFPSNHSVFAGALAVTVVAVSHIAARRWIGVAAVFVGLAIAASRVVLGVHYWWDVTAGLALGATVAAVALTLLTARRSARVDRSPQLPRAANP